MVKALKRKESLGILKANYIGRLAYISRGSPHIAQITYFYDQTQNSIIGYAADGHKIKAMRKNHAVSMLVDEVKSIQSWRSVLVLGKFEELHGVGAKFYLHQFTQGVKGIIARIEKSNPEFVGDFSSKLFRVGVPVVYRINILKITGKAELPNTIP